MFTRVFSLARFSIHTPNRLDERLITRLSVRENEIYEKTIKITSLTQFQCLPFDFSRSTEYPMRIFRLCVFLKNFSFQPRVERRKNHFYSFCLFYHVSVHLFWKFPLEAGESEVENTRSPVMLLTVRFFELPVCFFRAALAERDAFTMLSVGWAVSVCLLCYWTQHSNEKLTEFSQP